MLMVCAAAVVVATTIYSRLRENTNLDLKGCLPAFESTIEPRTSECCGGNVYSQGSQRDEGAPF
jgi:hypothetical protein